MRFSPLVDRIAGEAADAWATHTRAAEMARYDDEVILLSVGDPDADTPVSIVDAAIDSLRRGRTHYVEVAGDMPLREAVARYHNRYAHQAVTAENVVIVPGAQCALFAAAQCIIAAGDEIIVPEPMYVTYPGVIHSTGASIVPVPLLPHNQFNLQIEDVKAAITPRTRAILLNTPHNPTGSIIDEATLTQIAALCREHDLWVISDEVYQSMAFDQPAVSMASIPGIYPHSITVSSLSKAFAMTGWRLGWIICPNPLVKHLTNLLGAMLFGTPPFIQDAAAIALDEHLHEMANIAAPYHRRRDLVCDRLERIPNLSIYRPAGGMYVMIDVRQSGLTAHEFVSRLFESEKLSLLPADAFGPSATGHLRMTLTAPEEQLTEACTRLARFARTLEGG